MLPKGSVMKLTGLGGEITREDIKEVRLVFTSYFYYSRLLFLILILLLLLSLQVLKEQFGVNIEKDGGDIAFITYEKGEAEAKVGVILVEIP